jgi:SAM-dependent methyltransferase
MEKRLYVSGVWEDLFAKGAWGKYPSEEAIRFFMRAKKLLNKKRPAALDLGCGIGACAWFMAREGAVVTAVDGAPSGVRQTKKLAASFGIRGKRIEAVVGDIVKPRSCLKKKFDIILDHYSLYVNGTDEIVSAFRDLYDLLNDGGMLLTCCFGGKTINYWVGENLRGQNAIKPTAKMSANATPFLRTARSGSSSRRSGTRSSTRRPSSMTATEKRTISWSCA